LHGDLAAMVSALRLARATRRIMKQNLGWAVGYNLLAVPVAAGMLFPAFGILLSPAVASAAMALSSLSVLVNSLRLRHWRTA
jgi:P-type Cu+ transporter